MQTYFENFTLAELVASDKGKKKGIDNTPSFEVVAHLAELCENFLQPLRTAWESGIRINSGFRCKELNRIVGGSNTSVHMIGYAVDTYPTNGRFDDYVKFVRAWVSKYDIKFDQLIIESNKDGDRWLHIGLKSNGGMQRRQIKTIDL